MSKMSFMEWVGLFIVLFILLDFFQNDGYQRWFGDSHSKDKPSVSKKSSP